MKSEIQTYLAQQLELGPWTLGQILIEAAPEIRLRHAGDAAPNAIFERPEDARELAKYDDAGAYRPLKTAPNLRRGWELRLKSIEDLHRALDLFYPAALGTWLAFTRNELVATSLRATLARQTGMYRVTQLIRDDQAAALIEKTCGEGCLRKRLWRISAVEAVAVSNQNGPPILCPEACNLLVAACRPVAKQNVERQDQKP